MYNLHPWGIPSAFFVCCGKVSAFEVPARTQHVQASLHLFSNHLPWIFHTSECGTFGMATLEVMRCFVAFELEFLSTCQPTCVHPVLGCLPEAPQDTWATPLRQATNQKGHHQLLCCFQFDNHLDDWSKAGVSHCVSSFVWVTKEFNGFQASQIR